MLRPVAALATFAGMIFAGVVLPTTGYVPARGVPVASATAVQSAVPTGHRGGAGRHISRAVRQHDRPS
jgi:hypothetical protein